jgi:guanosine-3',5'-bis(diphosphate) 3'-pyrophosphohydrolase
MPCLPIPKYSSTLYILNQAIWNIIKTSYNQPMEQNIKDILDLNGHMKPKEVELIRKAYIFAERAHSGQKRMSGEPYFVHVLETAKILAKLGMDAQTIAAGFLHDTLEDTPTTEEELKNEFGEDIVFLVKGVTKLGTLKYRGHERHVESLRKFFIAMANDLRVVIIKFADRLHNLRTLQYVREDKRERIALESIEVYAPLANRLGMGKLKGDIEDAAFPYAYGEEYKKVEEIIQEKKNLYEKYLTEIKDTLTEEIKKQKIKIVEINYRVKHKYSLYKKLLKYDMDLDKIHDIVALRVVVSSVEECYRVLGLVHSLWNPLPGRIKDYIAVPKPNGYRSIHTTVFTGSGGIAEIQIRTEEMHAEAAYGIAAHFAYKENKANKNHGDKSKFAWIEELKELNYNPEEPHKFIEHLKTDFFNNRIFIFTPKGDVIDLPEDSNPIDFAYNIHSDIGNHTFGAKINGKMSQLFTKLKNGDIVEIITKKDSKPSSKWLEEVKTTIAKKHIRSYLEKNSLLAKLKSFGKS